MGGKMIVGIVLIVLGVIGLAYQGISYTTRERVADVGPIHVDADKTHTVWIGPTLGIVALVGGAALLITGRKAA
ncbi:MAG TPA: DUF3185 domain-containing protein [Phycisphaerae bacterium]|jgi:hypothetical protein|nr:DUF3185 domain-containing protein [Phycisphaerae bacterium]